MVTRPIARQLCAGTAVALLAGLTPTQATGAAPAPVAPHVALYVLSLSSPTQPGAVRAVKGQLETRVEVSCDGFTSRQYVGFTLVVDDGSSLEHLSRLRAFESADGREMIFSSETWEDREQVEELRGIARRDAAGAVSLRYTTPPRPPRALPPRVRFPIAHATALLRAARSGRRQLRSLVFDGSSEENPFEVAALIGSPREGGSSGPQALRGKRYWPVRLAYFLPDGRDPEPRFQMGLQLYESGIAGDMVFDYGGFAMDVTLTELSVERTPICPS
jgi:hypothetical protein